MVAFIDGIGIGSEVVVMCRLLKFSKRTYYAAKVRPLCVRVSTDGVHKVMIKREWTANYSCYGARRLHIHLTRQRYLVGLSAVARLIKILDIRGVQLSKKVFTTHPDKTVVRPPDPVKRDFTAQAPNRLWLANIAYSSTSEGWLSVSLIMDAFSRMIVGWQIASHMHTDLVLDALEIATWQRQVGNACVHHSDASSQGGFKGSSQSSCYSSGCSNS